MRELHGGHGDHGRHARDAHPPADNTPARAHDGPKHAAQDTLKLRMLLDPEARKAACLAYQQKVEAGEAEYAARHAKPKDGDHGQAAERLTPKEASPERMPPESGDRPNSRIASRDLPGHSEEGRKRKPERSWMPRADMVKAISDIGVVGASIAVALGDIASKWDAVAVCVAGAVVSNIALANRRWRDKHGDRSEG